MEFLKSGHNESEEKKKFKVESKKEVGSSFSIVDLVNESETQQFD